ncbi:MAG: hypothetical protein Q9202_001519 [Teloschistes flavicans]
MAQARIVVVGISEAGTEAAEWDKNTWPELESLARSHPDAGVHFQDTAIYNRKKDLETVTGKYLAEKLKAEPWYKDIVPNFRLLPSESLGDGFDNGHAFTSVCINTGIYLSWLVSQCLQKGVIFKRANVKHISEASQLHSSGHEAHVVVNCTGLSALKLGGVEDKNMMPIRGQTVLVRNEANVMCSTSGTDDGDGEVCYLMQRAAGIEHLDIIRQGVGLRPYRHGGTRIEKEKIKGVWIVHNYGHGGYGYQSSYGCSQKAVRLVGETLGTRSKL